MFSLVTYCDLGLIKLYMSVTHRGNDQPPRAAAITKWTLNAVINKDLFNSASYQAHGWSSWTWLTCEWYAGSVGSLGPWPAHRWRASLCLPESGHSAEGDNAGPHQVAGPPPWTCLPHLGRNTWNNIRNISIRAGEMTQWTKCLHVILRMWVWIPSSWIEPWHGG